MRITLTQANADDETEDGRFSFILTGREVRLLHLQREEIITEESFAEILSCLRKNCLRKSADLLSRQDYSRAKLREKLLLSCPPAVVDPVLDELTQAHYLDDERFARNYVRSHMQEKSRVRIRQDLVRRGIPEEMAICCVSEIFGEALRDGRDPERDQIRRLLRKREFDAGTWDWNEKQKIMAAIYRKGFSADKISSVMQEETDF